MQTQDDDTGRRIAACLARCQEAHEAQIPEQGEEEPTAHYGTRLLGYALAYGLDGLMLSQLELADCAAGYAVAGLPAKMSPDHARLDDALHRMRYRLTAAIEEKRRQRAELGRMLALLQEESDQEEGPSASEDAPAPEETDATRAARLMRAALMLIMGDQGDQGGGGSGARLRRPTPTRPTPGIALQPPAPPAPPAQGSARVRF